MEAISYRCTVCGIDVTNPQHNPEICKAVRQAVAQERIKDACKWSPVGPVM